MADPNNPQTPDYEALGRLLAAIVERGYVNKKRYFWLNFSRGVAVGLGSIIGATIVVALMIWILSLLDFVPFVQPAKDFLRDAVNNPWENIRCNKTLALASCNNLD